MHMHTISLIKLKIQKKIYIPHTTECLTVFMHAFCNKQVENLLKGPDSFKAADDEWDLQLVSK